VEEIPYYIWAVIGAILALILEARFRHREKITKPARILLDTSGVIDGRFHALQELFNGTVQFLTLTSVLYELRKLQESNLEEKSRAGKRGFWVLETAPFPIETIPPLRPDLETDDQIIDTAKALNCAIISGDDSLNRTAQVAGVHVVHVQDLLERLTTISIRDGVRTVTIVRTGEREGQGVGFLPDGTMIVVSGADDAVGKTVEVELERYMPTKRGVIVFARRKQV
jgi:uncharacterized protein YacL